MAGRSPATRLNCAVSRWGGLAERTGGSGAGFLWFRLFKPLLETAGYPLALVGWILGQVDPATVLFFLVASIGSGIVVSTAAVVLPALATDRGLEPAQLKRLFLAGVLENLGYRQIRNLALIVGFFSSTPPAP